MKPQNFEERLVWYCIISTYGLYSLGLIYPVNFLMGWVLCFYLCKQLWNQTEDIPIEKRIHIPWRVWMWVVSAVVMAIATVIGCIEYNVEMEETIKALLRWATEWALIGLFTLSGCLNIRPQLIYRAVCIVCLQSLVVIPLCYLAYALHLPSLLYCSPLEMLTPNGPVYYNVYLYGGEYGTNEVRLFLFAPWGPALGVTSIIYFFLALQETQKNWRWLGIVGSVAMCTVSVSRQAIISLPILIILVWALTNFTRPATQLATGISSFLAGIFGTVILSTIGDFWDAFKAFRPGSSQFHDRLGRIAFDRWNEAPIWGHGVQEVGPKIVAGLPIGSNHTWFGLLFIKGLVGFVAFLIPLLCTFIDLLIKAQKSVTAKVALSIVLTIFLFTLNDNQEVLFYLYWPGLVIIGIAFKEEVQNSILTSQTEEEYGGMPHYDRH